MPGEDRQSALGNASESGATEQNTLIESTASSDGLGHWVSAGTEGPEQVQHPCALLPSSRNPRGRVQQQQLAAELQKARRDGQAVSSEEADVGAFLAAPSCSQGRPRPDVARPWWQITSLHGMLLLLLLVVCLHLLFYCVSFDISMST